MDTFEIVPLAEIHRVVEPAATKLLQPLGFDPVSQLQWVRSADAPIRQLFGLTQWKGGKIAPRWGLSLDFVPHISGGNLKWHRTPKSVRFDLCIDARDRDLDIPYTKGTEAISNKVGAVIPQAISRAQKFWSTATSMSDLPAAFEWLKTYLSTGLGFYNFTQHPIAFAFVLAMNGRASEGQQELDKFINTQKHFGLDEDAESRLRQLFVDVAQGTKNVS